MKMIKSGWKWMRMHENGWESMKFYKMDNVESNNQRSEKIK